MSLAARSLWLLVVAAVVFRWVTVPAWWPVQVLFAIVNLAVGVWGFYYTYRVVRDWRRDRKGTAIP